MKHCVADYDRDCARRETSVWSLRVEAGKRKQRVLTLAVDPKTRAITEASGVANKPPEPCHVEILKRWAKQEHLQLDFA